jgi:hypothetical protein
MSSTDQLNTNMSGIDYLYSDKSGTDQLYINLSGTDQNYCTWTIHKICLRYHVDFNGNGDLHML